MTDKQRQALNELYERAKKATKGSYSVYNSFASQLYDLRLTPKEFETAVQKIARLLKV